MRMRWRASDTVDPVTYQSLSRVESAVLDEQALANLQVREKDASGLTIFISTWNHRAHLPVSVRSALRSLDVLGEAGFPAEHIVIDDASRDGSQKLLRSIQQVYEEPRLKTLFLNRNLGVARLRNLALEMSRFSYVCLLDADNELLPENLPLFLRSIKQTKAALVHGNLITRQEGEVVRLKSCQPVNMKLTSQSQIDAFSLVDARRLLGIGGYNPRFYSGEDWEMVLHLVYEEEKIVFVPAVLGYYNIVAGSKFRNAKPHYETDLGPLLRRMYAQSGTREWDPVEVGRAYHPDVGYIEGL